MMKTRLQRLCENWRRLRRSAPRLKQKRYGCLLDQVGAKLTFIQEAERAAEEEEQREIDIARGNPLLNARDFTMKRRWDDDVVFKNQARGTEDKNKKKEFINDMLRSDFHKKFMVSSAMVAVPPETDQSHSQSTFDEVNGTFTKPLIALSA